MLMYSVDELLERLGLTAINCEDCKHHDKVYISKCENSTWSEVCDILDYMTLIDAEPVVRCEDCKHCDPYDSKCDCGHAILWQLPRDGNWYCADGERRDDETDRR